MNISSKLLAFLMLCSTPAWAAQPVAVQDVRTIPAGVPITIDVLINDYDEDGDSLSVAIATEPANGSVLLNDDFGIQYTPNAGFSGQDRFTYTLLANANGDVAPEAVVGTVIVNVAATNLLSRIQGRNGISMAQVLTNTCAQLSDVDTTGLPTGVAAMVGSCANLVELSLRDPEAAALAINQIAPEESLSLSKVADNASQAQSKMIANRLSQLNGGVQSSASKGLLSWSTKPLGGSAGDSLLFSKLGLFASVLIEDANKEASLYEAGFNSFAGGVTVGVDYALSSDWFVGSAVGYTNSELEYLDDAGSVESSILSVIAYTTYHLKGFDFDAQLGYGSSQIDTERNINYTYLTGAYARSTFGETSGIQQFASVQAQYLFSFDALTLYPSAKLAYGKSTIEEYADIDISGVGAWDVTIGEQNFEGVNIDLGLQGAYTINTQKGVVMPTFNFNVINSLRDDQEYTSVTLAYAPKDIGSFMLIADEDEQLFYKLGLGVSMMLANGLSLFADVQKTLGYTNYSATQYQFGFRKEL